jgi:hypothetical protein
MLAAAALNEWLKYYGCAKGLELRSAECEYGWLNPFEFILALVRDSYHSQVAAFGRYCNKLPYYVVIA